MILCSSDVKNAEGKTALDLATDFDLLRAIRKHLNLESPEKCPLAGNATIEAESANDVASCAAEVTRVDETLDIMFTDQENAEPETVKQVEEVEKCEGNRGETEEINSVDEKTSEQTVRGEKFSAMWASYDNKYLNCTEPCRTDCLSGQSCIGLTL